MSLMNQASELLLNSLNSNENIDSSGIDSNQITNALQGLLPTSGGDIDFASLIAKFTQGNFGDLISSFLGDNANMSMMASQVISVLGQDNIINFASSLGIAPETASEILSNIIPDLIDKNSQGGGITQIAGKLLGGLFS
jgi:uncharacterized protein YidB (DUF937 family)